MIKEGDIVSHTYTRAEPKTPRYQGKQRTKVRMGIFIRKVKSDFTNHPLAMVRFMGNMGPSYVFFDDLIKI